ncbi:MAG: hypothetical protein J6I53_11030 [Treponema sp.]|nr:hypothetical protein [Treponema sp.]
MKRFEETMASELIKVYVDAYGIEAWTSQSDEEKAQTLHELLGSFLAVAKRHS